MSLSAFPYPGGKTPYWRKIVEHFPAHHTYVEPFGGSAAVLLNKEPSYAEVFNDRDADVVHFFRVLREQREDLVEWLEHVPYSRDVFEEWADAYWAGKRPADDVERAGRWVFLRFSNFNAALDRRNGFKTGGKRNEARSFRSATDDLDSIAERFHEVTIENQDYRQVIERYDCEDTLFYLDPPYVDPNRNYYRQGSDDPFDHAALVTALREVNGYWICSYGTLPDGLETVATVVECYDARYSMRYSDRRDEAVERLAMNFDPRETTTFVGPEQRTLSEVGSQDGSEGGGHDG